MHWSVFPRPISSAYNTIIFREKYKWESITLLPFYPLPPTSTIFKSYIPILE